MRIVEYVVIEETYLSDLAKKVNAKIRDGFVPQGGVCASSGTAAGFSRTYYAQAMVKMEPDHQRAFDIGGN